MKVLGDKLTFDQALYRLTSPCRRIGLRPTVDRPNR